MLRPFRLGLLASALVFASACGSGGGGNNNDHDDDQQQDDEQQVSTLAAHDLSLSTAEDTAVAGTIVTTGAVGAVTATVQTPPAHGTLTISSGTSFSYTPSANYAGTDSVIVSVSDSQKSATATVGITIAAKNDPPVIGGTLALAIDEDSSVTMTPTNLGITDVEGDTITVTVQTGANYTIAGNNVHPLPDFNGVLSVPFQASDGIATVSASVTLTVNPVNDAPEVTMPGTQHTEFGVAFVYPNNANISVADIDAGTTPIAIELSTDAGNLTLSTTAGLTFTQGDGTADGSMHFTGALQAVNGALHGLTVDPLSVSNDLITLTLLVSDQGATGSGGALSDSETTSLTVGATDGPPHNTIPGTVTVDEDDVVAFQGGNVIQVADADAPGGASVSVDLAVAHGTLTLNGIVGLSFSIGDGTADASLAFSGTFANVNAALDGMAYRPAADYAGADTLSLNTISNGLNDTDSCAITVAAVNDGPDITGPTSAINVLQGTVIAFTGGNAIGVSDVDAASASVKLTADANHGDFSFTTTPASALTTSLGHVELVGSLTQINADLALLQWDPLAFIGGTLLSFVINDQGATGSGGVHTRTLSFTINEAATFAATDDHYKAQGNVPRIIPAPGVLANDAGTDLHVTTTTTSSTLGGSVTMQADGGFTYVPPRGQGAREQDGGLNDSFTYTIQDIGGSTTNGVVTINIRRVIWFVDKDNAGVTQDGTFTAPYDTIAEAVAAAEPPSGSHFGTWIYVYSASTPYTVDVSPATGVSLFGSLRDFDLQDADADDPTDPFQPTTLPALDAPELQPATTTAVHLTANSKISGFNLTPGGDSTGPAVEGLPLFSGVIDNLAIDGFQTAIALGDLGPDTVQIDSVTITDAITTAISMQTTNASGLIVTQSLLQRVGTGIEVTGSAGPDDNGRIFLFVAATSIVDANIAVSVQTEQGSVATEPSSIRIASGAFTNGALVSGTQAMHFTATGGDLELRVTNIDVDHYLSAFGLQMSTTANANVLLDTVHLLGSYAENPARVDGSTGGRVDLTVKGFTLNADQATGFVITGNATAICLDMTDSNLASVDPLNGLSIRQTGAAFILEGYNGTDDVETYFHTIPSGGTTPRDPGAVGTLGTFTSGTCAEPPSD